MGYPDIIVVAVDGSEASHSAVETAAALSSSTGARVHLVHVAPVSRSPFTINPAEFPAVEDRFRATLDDLSGTARRFGAEVAEAHLRTGSVPDEITDLCRELGAGMLVVGSRGLGAVGGALLGSVSQTVIAEAPCPVLVVRADHPRTLEAD